MNRPKRVILFKKRDKEEIFVFRLGRFFIQNDGQTKEQTSEARGKRENGFGGCENEWCERRRRRQRRGAIAEDAHVRAV